MLLVEAMAMAGVAPRGQARRLIAQRAVWLDDVRVADQAAVISRGVHRLRVGKRTLKRLVVS